MSVKIALWGAGSLSKQVAKAISNNSNFELVGVASRHFFNAQNTANELCIRAYESYEDLLSDDCIDFVYVSTPTNCHYNDMKRILLSNKNVVCEKPFVESSEEAQEIFEIANKHNKVVVDGLWSLYMPLFNYIKAVTHDLGKLKFASASLGYPTIIKNKGVYESKYQLWDYQIYPVSIMIELYGLPDNIKGKSKYNHNITFRNISYLSFKNGGVARVHSSLCHRTSYCFFSLHSKGIVISRKWWFGNQKVFVFRFFKKPIIRLFSHEVNGYEYEFNEAFERYTSNECKYVSNNSTLNILSVLDRIKKL